jgi:hypothetical protein
MVISLNKNHFKASEVYEEIKLLAVKVLFSKEK